jgi:hypothetical protein
MYAVKVQDAFYWQNRVAIHYDELETQADDLKSFNAAILQENRWSILRWYWKITICFLNINIKTLKTHIKYGIIHSI